MNICIFGGSFNPIHTGHLFLAQRVTEILKIDKLIFIPAFIPPHKMKAGLIDSKHRLEMIKKAISSNDKFEVSDIELKRGGISYTFDTLQDLKNEYEKANFFLLVGYDNFFEFHKWKNFEKIFNLAKVVVINRNVDKQFVNILVSKKIQRHFNRIIYLNTPTIEISSTEIRDRIKSGLNVEYYLHSEVFKYIIKNNLYKQ